MKFGLSDLTIQKICTVLNRYHQVEQAILYGSRAKGTFRNGSDIDLALRGEGLTLNVLYQILSEIDDLLLPYTVDLSILNDIRDPDVIDHIRRAGVTFYEKAAGVPVVVEKATH
jgi:predicted nucleotidyltransferase